MKKLLLINVIFLGLFLIIMQLPFKAKLYGDATFHEEAKTIALCLMNRESCDTVVITKAPGPVLFYVLPYLLGGQEAKDAELWKLGVIWNYIWLIISILLIYETVILLFGEKAGPYSIVTAFIIPVHLYYGVGILAETLAFVGCAFFCYGTVALFKTQENNSLFFKFAIGAIASGLVMVVTARPNILLAMVLIPIAVAWLYWKTKNEYISQIKYYLISYLLASMVIVGIEMAIKNLPGNKLHPDQESYFAYVAHHGRYQFRTETWDWRFWDNSTRSDSKDYQDWTNSTQSLNEVIQNSGQSYKKTYMDWVVNDVVHQPFLVIKQFIVRTLFGNYLQISSAKSEKFTVGPLKGEWIFYSLHFFINIINLTILVTAFYGFFKLQREYKFIILLIIPWISLVIFHGLIYMEQRYLYPSRPFFIIFASGVLFSWLSSLKSKII